MRGSRNFRQGGGGGPGQSDKKSSDNFFFLSSANYTEVKWSISKKGSRGGPTFFRGSNFFQGGGGGSNCLFPIETQITCDFPWGGGVRTPCPPPPLDPHLILYFTENVQVFMRVSGGVGRGLLIPLKIAKI